MTPREVAARVAAAPANRLALAWLGLAPDPDPATLRGPLRFWRDRTDQGWDDAGQVLFDDLGRLLPAEARLCVGIHNLLVQPRTGQLVAASWGRFTFVLRDGGGGPRQGATLDGPIDLTGLGASWSVVDLEEHDAQSVWAAFDAAGR